MKPTLKCTFILNTKPSVHKYLTLNRTLKAYKSDMQQMISIMISLLKQYFVILERSILEELV